MLRLRLPLVLSALWISCAALAQSPVPQFDAHVRQGLPGDADPTFKLAAADVNGDGVPDVICANMGGTPPGAQNTLFLNDGRGSFTNVSQTHLPQRLEWSGSVSVADVDGDGDNDIFFGNSSSTGSRLLLNDGTGKFQDAPGAQFPALPISVKASAFVDIDGDQDMDLIVRDHVLVNDGKGTFTDETTQRAGGSLSPWGMAVADVDGDNDMDVVMTPSSKGPVLWINDGTGRFTDMSGQITPPSGYMGRGQIVLQDLTGDGAPELVIANFFRQALLWVNDGKGKFTDDTNRRMPAYASNRAYSILGGDLDNDGDVDLVLCDGANSLPNQGNVNQLYLNDGKGFFTDATPTRAPQIPSGTTSGAIADLDQDGDADLVFGNWNEANRVWQNRHRHVYASSAPKIGSTYTLEFYGQPGYANNPQPVVSFGGFQPMPIKLELQPWGILGVDPTGLFFNPGLNIPSPGGRSTLPIPIPNDPGFKGLKLYWQAIVVQIPLQHFTNTFADVIE